MLGSAATNHDANATGVMIFGLVVGAMGLGLWALSDWSKAAREQAEQEAALQIGQESETFCAKHVGEASARPACVLDIQTIRDNQSRRIHAQYEGML